MDHAILAFAIATFPTIGGPIGPAHQLDKGLHMPFIQQVAGLLPAKHVVGGASPGGAFQIKFALQKFQKQRRLVELPFRAKQATIGARQ